MLDDEFTLSPIFEQNNIPVAIVVNNLYAPYAGVFIQSLLDHASEKNNYDIIIFQRDISIENKRLLNGLVADHTNVSIRFYDPTALFLLFHLNCEEKGNCPIDVFCKIIFPHIFNYSGRVIAVDIDTLLKTDIARLIGADLEGYCVGGVRHVGLNGKYLCDYTLFRNNLRIRDYVQNVLEFGADDLKNYVNGGIFLFDRDKYVHELDIETILDTVRQGRYFYQEQDILNVLMKGRIKALDFAWNLVAVPNHGDMRFYDAGSKLYGGAWERAFDNPYLLHWAGKPKPWVCPDVPWGSEWWQTALRTPFVGHIIVRMMDALENRRTYFRKRYGKEVDVWEPTPKGTD